MLSPDYRRFLSALCRTQNISIGIPTLFEPFLPHVLAEQLIWRRGAHLWDTPAHDVQTRFSLRERTQADIVVLDFRPYTQTEVTECLEAAAVLCSDDNRIRVVALCNNREMQVRAESSPAVCAVGGYGDTIPHSLPFIRMDKTAEDAFAEHADGWFAPDNAEQYLTRFGGRLTICGGLGDTWCANGSPVGIHSRIAQLIQNTKGNGYLVGTGGCIRADAYLSLISLLGGVIRLR